MAQEDDFGLGTAARDGGADVEDEFFIVPGLLDEVVGARADGFDDVADGAVGGDHDDGKLRTEFDDAGKEIKAAFAGEGEVEQEEIELFAGEQIEAGEMSAGGEAEEMSAGGEAGDEAGGEAGDEAGGEDKEMLAGGLRW